MQITLLPLVFGALNIDLRHLPMIILNFAIAAVILTWLLFRPILRIMDKRREQIDSVLDEAHQKEKAATDLIDDNTKLRQLLAEEIHNLKEDARQSGEEMRRQILASAQVEAGQIRERAKNEAEAARKRVLEKRQREMILISRKMAEKIINRSLSEEDQKAYIDLFIASLDHVEKTSEPMRQALSGQGNHQFPEVKSARHALEHMMVGDELQPEVLA